MKHVTAKTLGTAGVGIAVTTIGAGVAFGIGTPAALVAGIVLIGVGSVTTTGSAAFYLKWLFEKPGPPAPLTSIKVAPLPVYDDARLCFESSDTDIEVSQAEEERSCGFRCGMGSSPGVMRTP